KLVDLAPHRLVQRLLRSRMSLCTNEIVPGLIARHLAGLRFEDTALPLGIVATNLSRGRKRLFRAGPLDDAILASTSPPPWRWARRRSSPSTSPPQPREPRHGLRWECFANRSASFRRPAQRRW